MKSPAFYHDATFDRPSDGIHDQARMVAAMTFVQPSIEDELIAHSLGVRLVEPKRFWKL